MKDYLTSVVRSRRRPGRPAKKETILSRMVKLGWLTDSQIKEYNT